MTDTVLVLAWLVFAHLIADFVLQNDWIALNKGTGGRTGWSALTVHGFHVGLCLVPFAFAYGPTAITYLVVVVGTHILVDRWKVLATRSAERSALDTARRRLARTGAAPTSGLGSAWSPWPGILFLADQVLHLTIAIVGWLVILEGIPLQQGWVDFVNLVFRSWDRAQVHAVVLTAVILVSLFIANTRAAYYFVLALVSPRELPHTTLVEASGAAAPSAAASSQAGYTVRVGPIVATVEPGVHPGAPEEAPPAVAAAAPADPGPRPEPAVPSGAPARIGATIGALERLLIAGFVLVSAEAVVGFVIAAKTIARFKQLDDRGFAEYYLLGTLASVSVALLTAVVAKAALDTIP